MAVTVSYDSYAVNLGINNSKLITPHDGSVVILVNQFMLCGEVYIYVYGTIRISMAVFHSFDPAGNCVMIRK